MRPIELPDWFVNQSAPSGPVVIAAGALIVAPPKFVTTPAVVIRPIEFPPRLFVNHSAPSGPLVIPIGLWTVASLKVVTTPAVVMRPIEAGYPFVNHNAPSGPVV